MSHVFISYVREDASAVAKLYDDLSLSGVTVWLDRNSIQPGARWKQSIRKAIEQGAFFIACFSQKYADKVRSYMNEELLLAVEELRLRSTQNTWFIPVKLSDCEIPDREIGGGERLTDLQWVDLFTDWEVGLSRLLDVVQPLPEELQKRVLALRSPISDERAKAAEELYYSPDPRALRFLLRYLYDPEPGVTYWIVKALGQIPHQRSIDALVQALDDPEWRGPRYKLAEVVAAINNPDCYFAARRYEERRSDPDKEMAWFIEHAHKTRTTK